MSQQYSQSQIQQATDLMKKSMSVDEINNFDTLSTDEQNEYVSGFIDNIKEWKETYLNQQSNNQSQQGGQNTQPDDGLRHWQSSQQQQSQEKQSDNQRKTIEDQHKKAEQAVQDAQQAAQDAKNQSQSSNAQDIADAAQDAAHAAQQAARSAQEAANAAADAAQNSNDPNAQQAADAAQDAADQAQQAADAAQDAADQAQQAAGSGDIKAAQQAAQQAAREAQNAADHTIDASKAMGDVGEYTSKSSSTHSQRQMPVLGQAKKKSSFGGKVSREITFAGNDVLSPDDYEKAKEIAERAGQPVDSDDYDSPEQTAAKKYAEAKRELRNWNESKQGFGNSPIDLTETISQLFASKIDWQDKLREFMTAKANVGREDTWTKRYMGLDPSHPKYGSRYLHPRERVFEKRSGIADVFFLVDASGSMDFICGDGSSVFEHIMSELIQIEMEEHIQKSAYAAFNQGEITEDDVITWTRQDAPDEDEIAERLPMPSAGGGTSCLDAVNSINKLDNIYNPDKTLLIIVTDGYDNYSQIHKIMSDEQLSNTIFLITRGNDSANKQVQETLENLGVESRHIITVNTETEWGSEA